MSQLQDLNPFWKTVLDQARSIVDGEPDLICNLANLTALVFEELNNIKEKNVNWVGFYLLKGETLVLGPFQGRVACTRIAVGKGVCGTAAQSLSTQFIPDVHEFPGHIACDSASESEVVVPIIVNGKAVAVFDLDNVVKSGFTVEDQAGLEAITRQVIEPLFSNYAKLFVNL